MGSCVVRLLSETAVLKKYLNLQIIIVLTIFHPWTLITESKRGKNVFTHGYHIYSRLIFGDSKWPPQPTDPKAKLSFIDVEMNFR